MFEVRSFDYGTTSFVLSGRQGVVSPVSEIPTGEVNGGYTSGLVGGQQGPLLIDLV